MKTCEHDKRCYVVRWIILGAVAEEEVYADFETAIKCEDPFQRIKRPGSRTATG